MTTRPFVLVAGMHRSGTSAVARVLHGMGFDLGPTDLLMGAAASNVYGHFEFLPVVEFNDALLDLIDSHWAAPVHDLDAASKLAAGSLGDEARAMLAEHGFGPGSLLKDPRFCLTLGFWRQVIEAPIAIVMPHRDPIQVAASLLARDGFVPSYSLDLWTAYHDRLLHDAGGLHVVPVDFAQLLSDSAVAVAALAAELGVEAGPDVVELVDQAAASPNTSSVNEAPVSEGHKVSRSRVESVRAGVLPAIGTLDEQPTFEPLGSLLGTVRSERRRVAEDWVKLRESQEAVDAERAEAHAVIEQAERDRDLARHEAHTQVAEAEAARDRARAEAEAQVAEAEAARDTARHHFTVASQARDRLRRELDELQRARRDELASLQAELEARHRGAFDEEREALVGERDHFARELDTVYGSRAGQIVRGWWSLRRIASSGISGLRRRSDDAAARQRSIDGVASPLPAPVHLEPHPDPVVTIVIPVYGQLDMTARCLESLKRQQATLGFEVVVVDDQSPDETPAWLAECTGFNVLTNEQNSGFLATVNRGAAQAAGRHVLLLNNDAELEPGCLDALIDRLESDDSVGAVGAKLVYPDGVLQEAGSIIWNDATGWNYGKGLDAADWRFNFVREVDYCSAACLLVRGDVWLELGGFDARYAPAYYEDTDLCFRIRESGGKVLYEPAAVAVHHEGASHGTDETQGVKAHQVANQQTFFDRWRETLEAHHHPPDTSPHLASWRGTGRDAGRIIVFDHEVPASDQDSGSVRMETLLRILRDSGRRVTFFPHNRFDREPYASMFRNEGIEVGHGWDDWGAIIESLAPELDAVIVSRPSVAAELIPIIVERAPDVPVVYDMVDFHGLRLQRRNELDDAADATSPRHAEIMVEFERALVRMADHTIAITNPEAEAVLAMEPDADVVVVPNVHSSPRATAPFAERSGVMFCGSYRHPPNRDAIRLLMDDVMPLVWRSHPEITLHLVGSDMPSDIVDPSLSQVQAHGWVDDLGPLFDQVRLSVAPLRFGAGMKGKVGDSLCRGVPIVSTAVGAEGFGPLVSDALVVAESPAEIAAAIVALHEDEARWESLADAGVQAIAAELSPAVVAEALLGMAPLVRS